MKKFLALLLLLAMLISVFAGCGEKDNPETPSNSGNIASSTGTEKDEYTIGVVIWSTDDATTGPIKSILDYLGGELGFNFRYKTGDFDAESQLSAVENFVDAGVDGIMIVPLVDASIGNLYQVCEDAKIPYVQFFRGVEDEELAADMLSRDYFLGWTSEDDVAAGYHMVEILAEQGADNVACIYMGPGNQATDDRQTGMEKAFEAGVANKVTDYILPMGSADATLWTQATQNFINQYGDGIDAIISSVGSNGGSEAVLAAIESSGVDYIAGEFDPPSTAEYAFEKGYLGVTATGMMCDPVYAFVIMANYLMGTPLSEDPICLDTGYIYITSAEDQASYTQYVDADGVYAYHAEEISNMLRRNNPDFTAEDLQQAAMDWSLQDVINRHR